MSRASTYWLLIFPEVEHLKEEGNDYINENNTNNNSNFNSNNNARVIRNE
jgi:hypothetical protein